jgi:hypothetical protein
MDVTFHILSLYFLSIKYYTLCVGYYVLMFKIPNENVDTRYDEYLWDLCSKSTAKIK